MTDGLVLLSLALLICGLIVLLMYGIAALWRATKQERQDAIEEAPGQCPPCNHQCNEGRKCPRWLKQEDSF